jgi:hypothetical protein
LFLPFHSRILKEIATANSSALTSNSSALAIIRHNVGENTFTLKDILLAMRRFDELLLSIQSNIMKFTTQKPSAGLFPQEAPLQLFDAIGRELPVPSYLVGSFDVSGSRFPSSVSWAISLIIKRSFTASLSSSSEISVVTQRFYSESTISLTKTAREV